MFIYIYLYTDTYVKYDQTDEKLLETLSNDLK